MGQLSDYEARMLLTAAAEPGDNRLGKLLLDFTPIDLVSTNHFLPPVLKTELAKLKISELLNRTQAIGAEFLTPTCQDWPVGLNLLGELAPLGIWKRGSVSMPALTVSVVGARSCTAYGEMVATNISAELNQYQVGIVSGGAFGIDAAAHSGALATNGLTIAVLAGGVDVPYPRANSQLFDRIIERGWIVSESPPGSPPLRHRFLIRNRLIAAWSLGTVVVEARIRSGAISTASHANNLGLQVMAIPGPINAAASTGSNRLIQDGATLVTSAQDILHQLRPLNAA